MAEKHDGEHRLVEIMRDFDVAMLVTHTTDGELRARPMFVAEVTDDGRVSFATQKSTSKVHELEKDARVVVCFQKDDLFASLNGIANVRDDHSKIEALWRRPWKAWFPKGKDDPDLAILEVQPHDGELWDQTGRLKPQNLAAMLKALATGHRVEHPSGSHESVHLRPGEGHP